MDIDLACMHAKRPSLFAIFITGRILAIIILIMVALLTEAKHDTLIN